MSSLHMNKLVHGIVYNWSQSQYENEMLHKETPVIKTTHDGQFWQRSLHTLRLPYNDMCSGNQKCPREQMDI